MEGSYHVGDERRKKILQVYLQIDVCINFYKLYIFSRNFQRKIDWCWLVWRVGGIHN